MPSLPRLHSPSNQSREPRAELAPARALLTPTWIGALLVLIVNDHALKGAGVLPGLVTGKLSDLAGMIVAPALLAALLGVRSRRGLAWCHAAVALVFAGIQLSPAFAGQWSALMGAVGYPWTITSDPTDLLALPVLGLGWALLVPSMNPELPALAPLQRTAVAALSGVGLWSTVATSYDTGMDLDGEWYVDVYGQAYVNNANDFDLNLHVRYLRSDLAVDCDEVSLDPGRLLTDAAFGEAVHWSLPPRTNLGVDLQGSGSGLETESSRTCGAALIAGEGIPTTLVFVDFGSWWGDWFPGQTFDPSELEPEGMAIVLDEGGGRWIGGEQVRHSPTTDAPELPAECAAPEAEHRLDWSEAVPGGPLELVAVEPGVDGCFALTVQELTRVGDAIEPAGEPYPFYLCAPALAVPFVAGDRLDIDEIFGGRGERELALTLLDYASLEIAVADSGAPLRLVRLLRGGTDPQFIGPAIDRTVSAVPEYGCPWLLEDACATVERPATLAIAGEGLLEVGVPVEVTVESGIPLQLTGLLSYARERAVVDPACSDGATSLHYDLDFVVVQQPG